MNERFELFEKLLDLDSKFSNDPEVVEIKVKLKSIYERLEGQTFTEKELGSSEMEEALDDYYEGIREFAPDEWDLFHVVHFI